jgi:putative ABC transport system ATP-binding protein
MTFNAQQEALNSEILNISSKVCEDMGIAFSTNEANESLADIHPEGSDGGDIDAWRMLDAVGQRAGIKYRDVESSFGDLLRAAKAPGPVITELIPHRGSDKQRFAIILGPRGPRGGLTIYFDGKEENVSKTWLKKNAMRNESGLFQWQLAQPMFALDQASAYNYRGGTKENPLQPIRRFLSILKQESSDIRSVITFAIFVGILSLTTPLAVEALVNTIAFGRYLQPLLVLSLIVFVFLAFRAGISVLMTVVVEVLQRRIFVRVVDDLSMRLTRVPMSYLKSHHGPELVNRFFDVVTLQKVTAKLLLESLMLFLQTIIGMTVLAFYHPFLLGYDIGLMSLMAVVLFIIGRGAINSAKKESYLKYETGAWLQEIVRHPTTFKFNGGLGFALNRADELAGKYIQSRREHFRILIRQYSFSMMMQAVAATVLLGLGGYLVIDGQLTLGQLVAAELIVTVILGSFAKIGKDLESFYDLMASVDKLGKLFDLPGEAADRLQMTPRKGPAAIELVGLKFLPTCKPLDASIQPGSSVSIEGGVGSGKTKIIETIAGLHAPLSGYASINDFRVDLIGAASLQSQLAYINDIEIFDGTIEENLRLGRSEIDSASINDIFADLGMQSTVTKMSDGYKTRLSVYGYPLSTCQSVRLVLARALISKPPALLIDGILDRLSDKDVPVMLEQLEKFKTNTTIIVTSGRRAVLDWADQKLILD